MKKYFLLILSVILLMFSEHNGMLYGQNSQWFHYGLFKTNCMVFFNGEMLVGTTEGIFAVDPDKYTSQKKYLVDENQNVVDLFKVGNKRLWCLTSESLYFVANNIVREYLLPENVRLEKGNFRQVCEGYNGKIYIGTTSGFFKGDSTKMEFCNSNEFASREVGVKEILTHSSGKVIIHFGSANEQDWSITPDRAGEFLLIDEKGAGSLKLIDNVLYVAMDSKSNLYVASHNPYLNPQSGTPEKLNYTLNKKIFEGKSISILPVSNKLGQKPPNYSSDHSVTKVDPQYRMISQQYSTFLFFIRFIDVDNNDKLLKYEDVGDCGGRWIPYTRAVYDDRNRPWYSSDRPVVRYGDSHNYGNDIKFITKNPYFYSLYDSKKPFGNPIFVTGANNSVFYSQLCFLGSKTSDGWLYYDYEHMGIFYGLTTTGFGYSFAQIGGIWMCFYGQGGLIDLQKVVPVEGIAKYINTTLSRNLRYFSLVESSPGYSYDYNKVQDKKWYLMSINDNSRIGDDEINLSGPILYFEEIFSDQFFVMTEKSAFLFRNGKWVDIKTKYFGRNTRFYKASLIADKKLVCATTEGLLEIYPDLKSNKKEYPTSLGKLDTINLLQFDCQASLWLSANKKLYRYDNFGWNDHTNDVKLDYLPARNLGAQEISLMTETSQASFISNKDHGTFISSLGGTYQYYDGKWRLISPSIFGYLVFDEKGNLMIFHSKGVSLYNLNGVKL